MTASFHGQCTACGGMVELPAVEFTRSTTAHWSCPGCGCPNATRMPRMAMKMRRGPDPVPREEFDRLEQAEKLRRLRALNPPGVVRTPW